MVIYKYVLDFDVNGDAEIKIPKHSFLLKVGVRFDKIVLWYQVNPFTEVHSEKFKVVMTGEHFASDGLHYIDTVTKEYLIPARSYHVFKVTYN